MVLRARKGERIEKHHDVRRGVSFGDPAEIRTPDTLLKRQMKVTVYQHKTAVLTDK